MEPSLPGSLRQPQPASCASVCSNWIFNLFNLLVECLLKGVYENVPYFLDAFTLNFVRFRRKFLITSQMSIPY